MAATQTQRQGQGWVIYSGIMLLLVGVKLFLDGLWALDHDETAVDALYYSDDLGTWAWVWLISGLVIFIAGISVFYRQPWARVVGIAAGVLGIIVNFFWLFAYPISALVGILLASLVVHGLSAYGADDPSV